MSIVWSCIIILVRYETRRIEPMLNGLGERVI